MSWLDENPQRERWELAVHGLRDGPWCWEVEANQFWCSPQFWRLLGYQDAEIDSSKPTRFDEHVHPDDKNLSEDLLRHHLDEPRPYDVQLRLRQRDGSYNKFRLRGSVECNEQGKPIRVAGTMQNVSDSSAVQHGITQRTEDGPPKAKRTSNEQYHLTPVMMHSTDTDGRLIDVSDFWCQHLGYQPDRSNRFEDLDGAHRKVASASYRRSVARVLSRGTRC